MMDVMAVLRRALDECVDETAGLSDGRHEEYVALREALRRAEEHDVLVVGRWHNDNTAGVYVWCDDCERTLIEGDEFNDVLTPQRIAQAVFEHAGVEA